MPQRPESTQLHLVGADAPARAGHGAADAAPPPSPNPELRLTRVRPRLDRIGVLAQRARRPILYMALLAPIMICVYYLSFWIRFEGEIGQEARRTFWATVAWVVPVKLGAFAWSRSHRSWGRFLTFYDLLALVQAATVGMLFMVLVNRVVLRGPSIPRSVFLLDWGCTIVFIGGVRAALRTAREGNWLSQFYPGDKTRAIIVGANDAGEALLRAIRGNERLNYRVVGFLDDDPRWSGASIGGVPVIGTVDQACRLAEHHRVREVLIAGESLPGSRVRQLMEDARRQSIQVKVLPGYEQLISGRMALQARPVSIHDLLRREPVHLDLGDIRQWIDDRVLLVTGSAGSIGSEICRQLLQFAPRRLVMIDRWESGQFFLDRELSRMSSSAQLDLRMADVLDEARMRSILDECRPDVIFHAAAYKHVPLMESQPGEAVKNILLATRRLADLAVQCRVGSFVLISTDKAVNPTSVMGACKRAAELYVQSQSDNAACRFVTVRFGNVLDSAGSVVQVFREQIARGGPVTVTDPRIERYFMTIPEAARLVIQAGAIGRGGEILLLDMGEPLRIVDLAADMIRLSGLEAGRDVRIEFTGLRPGEKLFEELHVLGETLLPTRHPKIHTASHNRRNPAEVLALVGQLIALADGPAGPVLATLQQLVPQYAQDQEGARAA